MKKRAVVKGRSILALDVLGEVRRVQRILRRVEKYLHQVEQRAKRLHGNGDARVTLTTRGLDLLLGRAEQSGRRAGLAEQA
jgi:hypothetical protein